VSKSKRKPRGKGKGKGKEKKNKRFFFCNHTKMDLQGKEEPQPSLPATSPSTTEFNSYSTISTIEDSSSPERIFNLPKSTGVINLPSAQQHMNRVYEVPDPNRIPQSIFARTNSRSAQMEWSVTSNESLFSIHVAKPSDLSNTFMDNPDSLQTKQLKETSQVLKEGINGPLMEAESEHQDGDLEEKLEVNENLSSTSHLNFNLSALTTPCESPGTGLSGRHSETSTLSHNSFAFPV
jgi:hypothetical protein